MIGLQKTSSRWACIIGLLITVASFSNDSRAWAQQQQQPQRNTLPPTTPFPENWMPQVKWRSIGPANIGGRITAIAVYEKDPMIWWAATASGGLLKTTNNGITFEHQFDRQTTVSIGDVQVAQSDPNIVWVGTGEANPRNSVSWGDGVYKSTDGGKTWTNKGLKGTFQIGRMAIHPTDPNIVYVGALGRLWGPSDERGLYKSADGGETWKQVLFVDDKTGVIDVQIDPNNPANIVAATYERMRDGFDGNDPVKKYGPGAGIYRSTDAGETFARVTQGLPSVNMGRIGLEYYRADTNKVFAIVETERIAKIPDDSPAIAIRTVDAEIGARVEQVTPDSNAAKAGLQVNDVIVGAGGVIVHTSAQFWKNVRLKKAGEKLQLEVSREKKPVKIELELDKAAAQNGRIGSGNPFTGTLGGQAANLQNEQGADGVNFGGVYRSDDGGLTWNRINTLNPRPMYYSQIRVDPVDAKYLYVLGTSMHRSTDGGGEFVDGGDRGVHPDHHALWIDPKDPRHMILGNDGGIYVTYDRMENWDHLNHVAIGQFYHVGIDQRRDYWIYGGLQDNGSWGGPARSTSGNGPVNTDWINVGGGDGFVCLVDPNDPQVIYSESQNGGMMRINTATGQQNGIQPRPQRDMRYRFNWKTPFALSPQNSGIYYSAGNYVFRSVAEGNGLIPISPEITNSDEGSGSAIGLSPLEFGLICVGTTDGAVWITKDDGKTWTPIYSKPQPKKLDESKADVPAGPRPADIKGIAGIWKGSREGGPGGRGAFELELTVGEADQIGGTYTTQRGSSTIEQGSYDPATGKLSLSLRNERMDFSLDAEIRDSLSMSGTLLMGERGEIAFEARRDPPPQAESTPSDVLSGTWELVAGPENRPEEQKTFTLKIQSQPDQSYQGTVTIDGREIPIDEARFDSQTKKVTLNFGDAGNDYELSGAILTRRFKGALDVDFGTSAVVATGWHMPDQPAALPMDAAAPVGDWSGVLESESIPEPANALKFSIAADPAKGFAGKVSAAGQEFLVESGSFDPTTGKLTLTVFNENATVQITARIINNLMVGDVSAAGGAMRFDFSLVKVTEPADPTESGNESPPDKNQPAAAEPAAPALEMPAQEKPAEEKPAEAAASQEQPAQEKPAQAPVEQETPAAEAPAAETPREQKPAQETPPQEPAAQEAAQPEDPVVGSWTGSFIGAMFQGDRGRFEMSLNRDQAGKITGTINTARGETKITDGSFDAASGKLQLFGENENSNVEVSGTVADGVLKGTAQMAGGRFTVDLEATHHKPGAQAAATGDTLEKLVPGPRWVSSITCSRYDANRIYITLDGHRSNDDAPYVFASDDQGVSWRSLRANLPQEAGSVHVLREDTDNENLLFLGCEFSAWVSIDRGQSWAKLSGMPTVAVHEFAFHELTHELVAATHGRSIWIADINVLKQLDAKALEAPYHLFSPNAVVRWRRAPSRGSAGTRSFTGQNPDSNAGIAFLLKSEVGQVEVVIRDIEGTKIKTIAGSTQSGLQSVAWDFSTDAGREIPRRGNRGRTRLAAGAYLVELQVDGLVVQRKTLTVLDDPRFPELSTIADEEDTMEDGSAEFDD